MTGYSPHYLMFGRHPHLPVDFYFSTWGAHVHSCHVPTYVEEVRRCFKEAYIEVHLQTNSKVDRQKQYYDRVTSTMQLMPGNVVLMKLVVFQGKRKVKDRWSEVEYVVVHDVPTYEVRDDGRNIRVTWSALVELTPLVWRSEMPESEVDEALTQCLTNCVPFGWIDGILWPLPSMALWPTLWGLGSGEGTSSFSDEDIH